MNGSWWGVLKKCGPLEKGMASCFSILALRTPWTLWEGKNIWPFWLVFCDCSFHSVFPLWMKIKDLFKFLMGGTSCGGNSVLLWWARPCLVQFSSVSQLCPILCDTMDCSMPGFPVHHQLLKLAQTHVHQFGDAIQPSHPLSPPFLPVFNLSRHQGIFKWVSSSH